MSRFYSQNCKMYQILSINNSIDMQISSYMYLPFCLYLMGGVLGCPVNRMESCKVV